LSPTFEPPRVEVDPIVLALAPSLPALEEPLVPAAIPSALRPWVQSQFFSGGDAVLTSWHLSVIDGGNPRGADTTFEHLAKPQVWPDVSMQQGEWHTAAADSTSPANPRRFGLAGARPICGDFDGDGQIDLGLFVGGCWYIDMNRNGQWDQEDLFIRLGEAGDQPVTGDWNGDGKTDIGIFGNARKGDAERLVAEPGLPDADNSVQGFRKNAPPAQVAAEATRTLQLTAAGAARADRIDHVMQFGASGDLAVSGDFNGDGIDTIGVFRHGRWTLDTDGDGRFTDRDATFDYGSADSLPVVGDFDGDGRDEIGVFESGVWRFDSNNNRTLDEDDRTVTLGEEGDLPIVADWNDQGHDVPAIYRPVSVK
jgi:hypothetical protein